MSSGGAAALVLRVEIFQFRDCVRALVLADRAVFPLQPVDQLQQPVPVALEEIA
ncbi:hypothetical protein [Streptomyces sp. NPDC001604]|uniref:hypothetical protein n=1 Tax=Streptomyces sp. NPDC001604 TaxID=3364593 RepID=UPI0036A489C4